MPTKRVALGREVILARTVNAEQALHSEALWPWKMLLHDGVLWTRRPAFLRCPGCHERLPFRPYPRRPDFPTQCQAFFPQSSRPLNGCGARNGWYLCFIRSFGFRPASPYWHHSIPLWWVMLMNRTVWEMYQWTMEYWFVRILWLIRKACTKGLGMSFS